MSNDVKTLILDIETYPTKAYVWGLFDQNVGLNQIIEPGGILCWSAKFVDDDYLYFNGLAMAPPKEMLESMREMMDEADEVVGWNSNSFDIKILNAQFLLHGIPFPSPYKQVDLMKAVKSKMKFTSNKLDFVSQQLGVGKKIEHEGFSLWTACMAGDKDAWSRMREYNEQDVLLTEEMYHKLRPHLTTGVNRSLVSSELSCPSCDSHQHIKDGFARTAAGTYQRYRCTSCGAPFRDTANLVVKGIKKSAHVRN